VVRRVIESALDKVPEFGAIVMQYYAPRLSAVHVGMYGDLDPAPN
jgi:hypothetical protein